VAAGMILLLFVFTAPAAAFMSAILLDVKNNTRSVRDLNARLLGRLFGRILPSRHNKDAFLAQSDRGDLKVAVFLLRLSLQENREKQLTKII
jgi:hypothetical protein